MTIQVEDRNQIIRPGYLVSLKTSLIGNISYHKQVLEREHIVEDGSEQARWETKRVIGDRAEHDRGWKAQAEARAKVSRVCTNTAFGLLCPEERNGELQTAIAEAKQIAADFNSTARLSRINVYVIVGKIAPEQFDVVSAMAAEALELLSEMQGGITSRSAQTIRTAANELRRLSDMFSENGRDRLKEAIDAGREAARKIVKAPNGPAHEAEAAAAGTVRSVQQQFQQLVAGGSLALQVAA